MTLWNINFFGDTGKGKKIKKMQIYSGTKQTIFDDEIRMVIMIMSGDAYVEF